MTAPRFPLADRPRLWGTAVSHYQVEGDDPCDWTEWEASGRTRGGACGPAVRVWERYEDDLALARNAGANAFRFSVSWSRVEPERGRFDEAALDRYARITERMVQLGLEPAVTLFHYTHPLWFHRSTPWTDPGSVQSFARYARRVATVLGPAARVWTIFNEPLVFLLGGFVDGQIPPGISDPRSAGRALEHLILAHAAAAAEIRSVNPAAAIGVAHNMMAFAPERPWHPLDRALSRAAHRFYNMAMLEAMVTGRWSFYLPPLTWFRGASESLMGSLDFIGINTYSRLHLRSPGRERLAGDFRYLDRTGHGLSDNGWEIAPEVVPSLLEAAASFGLPVMITEHGIADAVDSKRRDLLRRTVAEIERSGVDLCGYFHWSLLDNFEWLDGYGPRFGLFEADRGSLDRRPRGSVELFRELGAKFLGKERSTHFPPV